MRALWPATSPFDTEFSQPSSVCFIDAKIGKAKIIYQLFPDVKNLYATRWCCQEFAGSCLHCTL